MSKNENKRSDVDIAMMINDETIDRVEKTSLKELTERVYELCKEDGGVHDSSFIMSQVFGDYIIRCAVRGIVPKSGYSED